MSKQERRDIPQVPALSEAEGETFLKELDDVLAGDGEGKTKALEGVWKEELRMATQLSKEMSTEKAPEPDWNRIRDKDEPKITDAGKPDRRQDGGVWFWRAMSAALLAIVAGMFYVLTEKTDKGAEDVVKEEATEKIQVADDKKKSGKPAPKVVKKEDEKWVKQMKDALQRQVSFEFVDTPLEETLVFFNSISKVNIILDPAVVAEGTGKLPINLKVANMPMDTALTWILRLAQLSYDFRNLAIFVSKPDRLVRSPVLKVYNLRAMKLNGKGLDALLRNQLLDKAFKVPATSIAERDGMLVVIQRPQIQEMIGELLRQLGSDDAPGSRSGKGILVSTASRDGSDAKWKEEIRKKLQNKVSFEFVDTPMDEAIAFVRNLSDTTIVVDPRLLEAGVPPINLRVTDMKLDLALGWVLKLADTQMTLRDRAIFISKGVHLAVPELRVYLASDLVRAAPKTLEKKEGETKDKSKGKQEPTLADLIQNTIAPESWDGKNTIALQVAGKLVIRNSTEIHKTIEQLLNQMRKAKGAGEK